MKFWETVQACFHSMIFNFFSFLESFQIMTKTCCIIIICTVSENTFKYIFYFSENHWATSFMAYTIILRSNVLIYLCLQATADLIIWSFQLIIKNANYPNIVYFLSYAKTQHTAASTWLQLGSMNFFSQNFLLKRTPWKMLKVVYEWGEKILRDSLRTLSVSYSPPEILLLILPS